MNQACSSETPSENHEDVTSSPQVLGNHRFLSGVLGRKNARVCANVVRPSIPDRSVCTKPLPIYRGLNVEVARKGRLAVPYGCVFRVEEMARKRRTLEGCWRAVEEGAAWTHLSLRLRGMASNGRIALMRER